MKKHQKIKQKMKSNIEKKEKSGKDSIKKNLNGLKIKTPNDLEKVMTKSRLFLFPIKHQNLWKICEKMKKNTWYVDSMDFSKCEENFKKLNKTQQIIVKNGLISATILEDFIKEKLGDVMKKLKLKEIKHYLIICLTQEEIHWYGYQKLMIKYCGDDIPKELKNIPNWLVNIKNKVTTFFENCKSISEMILGLSCLESMLFHETFVIPYILKCENLLPILTALNSEISRDENIHAEFWCSCLDMICVMTEDEMIEVIDFFYNIGVELCVRISTSKDIMKECKIVNETVEESNNINMVSFEDMKLHLLFLKNKLQKRLNIKYKKVSTPLKFMSLINSYNRANFFESIPTDYNKVHTKNLKLINIF